MKSTLVLLLACAVKLNAQLSTSPIYVDARIINDLGLCPGHTGAYCQDGNPGVYYEEATCGGYVVGCQFKRVVAVEVSLDDTLPSAWSGTIPSQLAELTALAELSLANAGLSGTIPPAIWMMTSLDKFSVGGTQVSGTLPAASPLYAGTKSRLSLGANRFSGEIPAALTQNPPNILYLDSNNFQGRVPAFGGTPLLCQLGNNPELACPFNGPSNCDVACTVDCSTNNKTLSNCTNPLCLAMGIEVCYDPCDSCARCVLNTTLETYSCEQPIASPSPSPSPISQLATSASHQAPASSTSAITPTPVTTPTESLPPGVSSTSYRTQATNYYLQPTDVARASAALQLSVF